MYVKGLQKVSLVDYPGKVSTTVFTSGCNFRCGYCHNPGLVLCNDQAAGFEGKELLSFLESRRKWIDGVCISGGEPTLHSSLPEFAAAVKALGLLVKLDTNGTNPEMIEQMVERRVVDYIAMDLKAPLERYEEVCSARVDVGAVRRSISLLLQGAVGYEFRTTLLPRLHSEADIEKMGLPVRGARLYALQQFRPAPELVDPSFKTEKAFSREEMQRFKKILENFVERVEIREAGANL